MKVLLSIKPEFAHKIFEGSKKFEFRKTLFKNNDVKTVVVYASSPVQKVIGEFEIEQILKRDLDSLWTATKEYAGIDKAYFDKYFLNKRHGFAIQVGKVRMYKKFKCLRTDFNLTPPQSFLYLK